MTSQPIKAPVWTVGPEQRFFGAPIGIVLIDCVAPFIPGSVGHAGTFSLPARYRTAHGVTFDKLLNSPDECEEALVDTAKALVREGAQLVTANCGFTARFQDAVAKEVDVPVCLSSLLLIPMIERMLPQGKKLGLVTATAESLTDEFWGSAGLASYTDRVVVAGLDEAPAFNSFVVDCDGPLDVAAVEQEVVQAARNVVSMNPDVGALLLECSEFPPYAAAVQGATGLPVFDFTSLIEFMAAGLARRTFTGLM